MKKIHSALILLLFLNIPLAFAVPSYYSFYNRSFSYNGSNLANVNYHFTGDGNDLTDNLLCIQGDTYLCGKRNFIVNTKAGERVSSIVYADMIVPPIGRSQPRGNIFFTSSIANPNSFIVNVYLTSSSIIYLQINYTDKPVSAAFWTEDSYGKNAIVEVTANANNNGHGGVFEAKDTIRQYYATGYHNYTDIPFTDAATTAQFIFESGVNKLGSACNSSPECNNDQTYANYPQIAMAANSSIDVGYNFFQGINNGAPEVPDQYSTHLYADGKITLQARQSDGTISKVAAWDVSPTTDGAVTLKGSSYINTSINNESVTIFANYPTRGEISIYPGNYSNNCMSTYNKIIDNRSDIPFINHTGVGSMNFIPNTSNPYSSVYLLPKTTPTNYCIYGSNQLSVDSHSVSYINYNLDPTKVNAGNITFWSTAIMPPATPVNFTVTYDSKSQQPMLSYTPFVIQILNMQMQPEYISFVPNCPTYGDLRIYSGNYTGCTK